MLRRLIELSPGFAEPYGSLAGLLLVEGKPDEAERVLRAGLAHSPDDRTLNGQMAQLLTAQGRDVEAQSYLIKSRR
jgi:Flp pilus assembly protein TadD